MVNEDDQGNLPPGYTIIYALRPLDTHGIPNDPHGNPYQENLIHVRSDARTSRRGRSSIICILAPLALIFTVFTAYICIFDGNYNNNNEGQNYKENANSNKRPPFLGPRPPRKICLTSECVKAAGRISALYKGWINPCHDFYDFTCGKILQNQDSLNKSRLSLSTLKEVGATIPQLVRELLEEEPSENVTEPDSVKKAKYLYNNCLSNQSTPSQWPSFIRNLWMSYLMADGLENLLAQLFAHGVSNIFNLQTTRDKNDTAKYILMFDKANPFRSRLDISAAKYIRDNLRMFASLKDSGNSSDSMESSEEEEEDGLSQEGVNIIKFERGYLRLLDITKCRVNDTWTLPEKITLARLQVQMPGIKWTSLVQQLFTILKLPYTISSKMLVYLNCSDYFRALLNLVQATGRRTVINYLNLRFIVNFEHLDQEINNPKAFENYLPQLVAESAQENRPKEFERWEFCARVVNDGLGLAVAHLYGKKEPMKSDEEFVREMFRYLKMAFKEKIRKETWISIIGSRGFEQELLSKLDYMKIKIGYPKYIMNGSALDEDYSGLNLNQSSFLLNVMEVRKFQATNVFMKIYRKVDNDKEWYTPPLVANAFYVPAANEIVLPAGILRFPMLDRSHPMYLNFANLGSILAHEMVHGFDVSGLEYDKHGKFTSWWPKEDENYYLVKAFCFVKQYEKFKMPLINKFVDGYRTLSENICDNAALPIVMRAYDLWESDGKKNEPLLPGLNLNLGRIFLVSFGQIWCEVSKKEDYERYTRDEHSPAQFRVLGVAQNSREFKDEFSCPYGSPMNPYNKCSLWF